MNFQKNKYEVVRNALPRDVVEFLFIYSRAARYAAELQTKAGEDCSRLGEFGDQQCPLSFSKYGDPAMDTFLMLATPFVESVTGLSLIETYSYYRVYCKGETLEPHKDRGACEISVTICLGGDKWPIRMDGEDVTLNAGDVVIYRGEELEHSREAFQGETCSQVFLHYNDLNGPHGDSNKFDNRLGLLL